MEEKFEYAIKKVNLYLEYGKSCNNKNIINACNWCINEYNNGNRTIRFYNQLNQCCPLNWS